MSNWTDERIEGHVERMMGHLDRLLLAGQMAQRDYDGAVRDLDAWAEGKYAERRRAPNRAADRIDGYDRDDLGESPDY
jgi:hypothetical protein